MALKLGKCRLCLKLGDFYSIFTVDNALQLAEMVMECAKVKIYEGDGLPDKICSECVQKLSSAFIFKQQCERSDQELRRNYVPPPGFSITPPPPNRQSSDSAFSSVHTNVSVNKPSSSNDEKITPPRRNRKRSRDSIGDTSVSSRSHDFKPISAKRVDELKVSSQKKPRLQSPNTSFNDDSDADYEDNSYSQFSGDTDSDEPLLPNDAKCKICQKQCTTARYLKVHMKRVHPNVNADSLGKDNLVDIPKNNIEDVKDDGEKLGCEKCGKTFKLKIMMKRHNENCEKQQPQVSPKKELLISLEPIDAVVPINNIECDICTAKFKCFANLEKHMRVVHAAVPKKRVSQPAADPKISVPCIFCAETFDDFYIHGAHFSACSKRKDMSVFVCPVCSRELSRKGSYFTHLKHFHFEPRGVNAQVMKAQVQVPAPEETGPTFDCRVCSKKLSSQEALISHLEAHMSIKDSGNADITLDEDSRPNSIDDSVSVHSEYGNAQVNAGPYKCTHCDKRFKYRKALETHESKHTEVEIKVEPPDKNVSTSLLEESYDPEPESESSQEEGDDDNTCDICEKQFSYKRLLIQHKRTKHNMSSGTKRAKINLKDCMVRCLICDVEMRVSAINEHNQKHITVNIKPRNLYTCAECSAKFKSCSALANHIKLIHRLKQPPMPQTFEGADLADFCEVVVTKAEPLDEIQSHNGFGEVPEKMEGEQTAFTCPICSKKMKTLISLKRHVNWHTNVGDNIQKTVECFVCKETFRFQSHYRLHMREHYHDTNLDPKFLTCSICNRKSKHLRAAQAHMNYHKQTRFKNKDYQCSICKRIFQHRKVYLSHMAIHYKRGESVMNTVVGDITPNNADKTIFDGKFTCKLCGKVCDSENSLKCHTSWHKSKTMLFGARHECYVCNTMFTNKRRLDIHVRSHYEDENGPYKCTICGKGYIDEEYFRRHVKGHNFDHQSHKKRIEKLRKDKVKCPICNRFYPDLVKLIRHLRRTHPESKMIKEDPDAPPPIYYSCKLCARVFLDERRLQAHEEAHLRKPEFFKCKFCGKKTISLKNHNLHIKSHLTQKYIDNPLKCPNCDEHFIKGYDLHHHLRDVHGITETWIAERSENALSGPLKELQCSVCLKVLASRGNFERHIDYHNSLRCNYCFDFFSSLRFLEGHIMFSCEKKNLIGDTEVFPKKVKCHICYKAFHVQVKLDCHLRTQHKIQVSREVSEGKQEIVCDYCFRVFENEYALTTHKIYHRTVGYYGCIYCNRKFNTLTLYKKHKNHHFAQLNVDNPTKCEHCDETFVAFREMIYHMRDEHNDDKEWIILPKDSIEETCHICNKTFFNLHRHLEYHEQNRCKKCAEYFYSMLDFDNHLCAIESDEENVSIRENSLLPAYEECVFCFKPVTRKQSKKLHDNLHKTSGSISCRFCPLKFKTIDAFNIHAFSHRSRKYNKKPIKCRECGEKFVKYGPFMRHMKVVHKSKQKVHYRAIVKPERCVVCGDSFPNLHNHYRAHLLNQCQLCKKYFTSSRLFSRHECDKEDADPSKVFISDENLHVLINSYIPKDDKDDEKYYGYTEAEDEEEEVIDKVPENMSTKPPIKTYSKKAKSTPGILPEVNSAEGNAKGSSIEQDNESQSSLDQTLLQEVHYMATSPIISDVLSLYQKNSTENDDVVNLTDDDSLDMNDTVPVVIEIDD